MQILPLLYQTARSTALVPWLAPVLHPGVVATSCVLRPVRRYVTTGLAGILASLVGKEWPQSPSVQSVCSWRKHFQGLCSPFSWNSIAKIAPLFLETFDVDQHLGSRCFATCWVAFVTFQLPVPAACQSAVSPLVGVVTVRIIGLHQ